MPASAPFSRRTLLALGAAALVSVNAYAEAPMERPDLAAILQAEGLTGTFVLLDSETGKFQAANAGRASRRFVPASTFKIPNSLIALETGAVRDENEVVPYGGQPQFIRAWERDMAMREALPLSSVPVYQEIARRVGLSRYRDWLSRFDYGNRDPGTVVDRFWLDGPLMISALEEARFNARLARGELPVSARSRDIVCQLLKLEASGDAKLFGKTGWFMKQGETAIGWWTGWVEKAGKVHAFALNIDMPRADMAPKRLVAGKAMLKAAGLYG